MADPVIVTRSARPRGLLALAFAVLVVAGCAGPAKRERPAPAVPERFSGGGEAAVPDRWWREFGDPRLNGLIEEALSDNPGLAAVRARLRQARAVWERTGADAQPTLDLGLSATEGTNVDTEGRSSDATARSASLTASYEVDLWGRIEAAARGEELRYRASAEAVQTAALTLAAEVARTWYTVVEQHRTLALIAEQAATAADYLKVLRLRFVAGQARTADLLQQKDLLASLRGDRQRAEANLATARHALAALLGRAPADAPDGAEAGLPALPALPETGLPAGLLRRRPDLRRAQLTLRAAEEDIAAAVAERFPRLSLTADATSRRDQWSGLLEEWSRTLVANLTAPLLDGGRRRAEVARTRARADELLADYREAVLEALVEVEDALAQERRQRGYLEQLQERVRLGRNVLERQRDYYRSGGGDFLNVLDAQRSLQARERETVAARRELIGFRIALYRALAGGFPEEAGKPKRRLEQATDE